MVAASCCLSYHALAHARLARLEGCHLHEGGEGGWRITDKNLIAGQDEQIILYS